MAQITPPAAKCNILWTISIGATNAEQMLQLQPPLEFRAGCLTGGFLLSPEISRQSDYISHVPSEGSWPDSTGEPPQLNPRLQMSL